MVDTASTGSRSRARTGVLVALCVTEVVSYGALYYAFTVLAPTIVKDTGWSQVAVTAAFSGGSLLGAAAGIPVGRYLQQHGPRAIMTAGSVVGAAGIIAVALAPSFATFALAWLVVGAATAGLYYSPAFAALTGWFGHRRVQAITTLTLAAGFASTIFAPLTAYLNAHLGWRGSYLVLAAIVIGVTLPAHAIALRLPWRAHQASAQVRDRDILTSGTFVLFSAAGTLTALVSYASLVTLPVLLLSRGVSPGWAAWAVGLGGAGQVAGRLVYPVLDRQLSPKVRTMTVLAMFALTLAGQALVPGPVWVLIGIAILTGAARGLFTLVTATVVADLWGTERYASISGVYNAPIAVAGALAPAIGTGIAVIFGGFPTLFEILSAVAIGAALLAGLAGRTNSSSRTAEAVAHQI